MTAQEALDAIAGKLEVSVFFMDCTPAMRVRRARKGEGGHLFCQSLPGGNDLTIDSGVSELRPGRYSIPRFSDGRTQPLVALALADCAKLPGPTGLGMLPLFVLDPGNNELYALCRRASPVLAFPAKYEFARTFRESATLLIEKMLPGGETSTEALNRRRYEMCEAAGLVMPANPLSPLPRGVGRLASQDGVSRQTFTSSVKAHIEKLAGK